MSLFGFSRVVSSSISWVFTAFVNTFTLLYQAVAPKAKRSLVSADVREIVRKADAVCFDVDSTVINDEGIVSLAEVCGVKKEVEKITNSAMSGGISFRQALKIRLNIIKPTENQVKQLATKYKDNMDHLLTPRIRELVKLLQSKGVDVFLISGGFIQLIEPIAIALGIPRENMYCNILLFNQKGEYMGFDEAQLTSDSGGKRLAVQAIKQSHKSVIMIGDGMTDCEASPPADLFIGFGGNVERKKVKEAASWYIYNFKDIINMLQN